MTRVLLVRHARPAAGFDAAPDPGLDPIGHGQADALAAHLGVQPPLAVVTSPLRRARETAAPLARRWACRPDVVAAFGEIPAPQGPPAERAAWLRAVMPLTWDDVEPRLLDWRTELLETLAAQPRDGVVVTHFVAINTIVGMATGDRRLVSCTPGHASVTEVEVAAGAVTLRSGPGS
ncbi:MAG TPA: histidine phosphatase family protein [Acidimicrobiia bacterium]